MIAHCLIIVFFGIAFGSLAASSVFAEETEQSQPNASPSTHPPPASSAEKIKSAPAFQRDKANAAARADFTSRNWSDSSRPTANPAPAAKRSPSSFFDTNWPELGGTSEPGAAAWTGNLQIIDAQASLGLPQQLTHWDLGGHAVNVGNFASHFEIAAARMVTSWPIALVFSRSASKTDTNILAPAVDWDDAYGGPVLSQTPSAGDQPFDAQPALSPDQYYAGLVEEHADTPSLPKIQIGTVTWISSSQISAQASQGLIPVANIAVTSAGLVARISVCCRANGEVDSSQFALDILLTSQPEEDKISNLDNPEMRQTGNVRGDSLSAKVLPQASGEFRVLLSQTPVDFDRNFKLLLSRPWIDIPLEFASGKKAILTFTTGKIGADAIYAALHPGH